MEIHNKYLLNGLSEFFKIFSDPTRLMILDVLLTGEKYVSEIAEIIDTSQSAVSHQLKNLRMANLVKHEKIGHSVKYSIVDEHIEVILKYGIEHILEGVKHEKNKLSCYLINHS